MVHVDESPGASATSRSPNVALLGGRSEQSLNRAWSANGSNSRRRTISNPSSALAGRHETTRCARRRCAGRASASRAALTAHLDVVGLACAGNRRCPTPGGRRRAGSSTAYAECEALLRLQGVELRLQLHDGAGGDPLVEDARPRASSISGASSRSSTSFVRIETGPDTASGLARAPARIVVDRQNVR